MWKFWKIASKLAPCLCDAGTIVIRSSGEIVVPLDWTPKDVWIENDDSEGTGVCHAEADGFDTKKQPNGFVIISTLNSSHRKLRWVAVK